MQTKKSHRERIIAASYNAVNDLIGVLEKGIDFEEVDPEKIKAAASSFKLAQQDAFDMLDRADEEQSVLDSSKEDVTDKQRKIQDSTGGFAEKFSK